MDELFRDGDVSSVSRGEEILTDGLVYYIESGVVGLYSLDGPTKRFIFAYESPDVFPYSIEPSIFPNRTYKHFVMQKGVLRSMPRERFFAEAPKPEHAKVVLDDLIHINQWQIERLDNLQHSQVIIRLLERLCFYGMRFGKAKGDKVVIEVPISHVDFASSIGTSRETVNRYMKQLESLGIVSVKRQRITINSYQRLLKITSSKQLPKHGGWIFL